ncbi:MAG: hypothetical protein HY529_03985 [Chloroflexi bacterium]|nr:hypothetical protein [Chloroflexota bacterium]
MTKIQNSVEKGKGKAALVMVGLTRSSSQEVADGYDPSIQKSELVDDAGRQHYQLQSIRDIIEPPPSSWKKETCLTGYWRRR